MKSGILVVFLFALFHWLLSFWDFLSSGDSILFLPLSWSILSRRLIEIRLHSVSWVSTKPERILWLKCLFLNMLQQYVIYLFVSFINTGIKIRTCNIFLLNLHLILSSLPNQIWGSTSIFTYKNVFLNRYKKWILLIIWKRILQDFLVLLYNQRLTLFLYNRIFLFLPFYFFLRSCFRIKLIILHCVHWTYYCIFN